MAMRRHRLTRSEACSGGASTSYAQNTANQSLISSSGQLDPATIMNQVMQNLALNSLLAGVSNQPGAGSPDFLKKPFLLDLVQEVYNLRDDINRQDQRPVVVVLLLHMLKILLIKA